jgi:hypothetical protein
MIKVGRGLTEVFFLCRRGRDYGRDSLGLKDGSEMVVSDVCVKGESIGIKMF